MTATKVIKRIPKYIINLILVLIFFTPFYWMVLTSVKTITEALQQPPTFWVFEPQIENFITAFQAFDFMHMLGNSVVVTTAVMLCQLLTVVPAAYAFARYKFKGRDILFGTTLATMMIPAQLIFLPVFLLLSDLGLINTYASLILPSATSAFSIFMLRQTFKQVPEELVQAAKLDKASELNVLWSIMLPIAKPTLITMLLLNFIGTWNDYFWPLVLTTNDTVRTLPLGIAGLRMIEEVGVPYNIMMAGNVLLLIPIVIAFFFAQKQIIQAFTYMGDK